MGLSLGIGLGLSSAGASGGGAPAFSPLDRAPFLWLRGDTALDSGAAQVTVDGTAVATWVDKSGNGRDVTQGTAGSRGAWAQAVAAANNQPGIALTIGTPNDFYDRATVALSQPVTVYGVVRLLSTATTQIAFSSVGAPTIQFAGGVAQLYAGSFLSTAAASVVANATLLYCAVVNGASSLIRVERTGVSPVESTGNAGAATLTGLLRVGANSFDGSQGLGGTMFEQIYTPVADDLAQRTQMLAYLRSRYGVTPL